MKDKGTKFTVSVMLQWFACLFLCSRECS